ncbi:type IX secretion system protein PorD [Avrilella dinanensis]|uniref:DUF4835 domain-containing protein n=1 Tax=Avrilella dinanensis TaxID=2008672 RepID=A0A2M9R3R8_9FLAO|nr:DUF4835 family protein [Avrilella dinanensis]PJR03500.1 hypothetical protein CDL10_02465 [Avrilella dinanensis]
MNKLVYIFLTFFLAVYTMQAQELNCTVTINTESIQTNDRRIFNTLESAVTNFMNNTQWTNQNYNFNEKINCSIIIFIQEQNNNDFKAMLQVISSRPVYNSDYNSPVFNWKDERFNFTYIENEPLNYNPNAYQSELVSVLSFYANMIVGLDADTFSLNRGNQSYAAAQSILSAAQQQGGSGWQQADGRSSRYFLITELLNSSYSNYRKALYEYHREGMDQMAENPLAAKQGVQKSIETLAQIHNMRPNALLTRVFFDAKADEIFSVFLAGPDYDVQSVRETLNRIYPQANAKWNSF